MNISFELIIPPVILGFLTIMILNVNNTILNSSVENRLTYELQSKANLTLSLAENEMRSLVDVVTVDDTNLIFATTQRDTIHIYRSDRKMIIEKKLADGSVQNEEYPLKLAELHFERTGGSPFITMRAITESIMEEEAGMKEQNFRAVAEKEFYFQNLNL